MESSDLCSWRASLARGVRRCPVVQNNGSLQGAGRGAGIRRKWKPAVNMLNSLGWGRVMVRAGGNAPVKRGGWRSIG